MSAGSGQGRCAARTATLLGLAAAALGATGCGGLFDVAYLVSDRRTTETKYERAPTDQVHTRIEYAAGAGADGVLRVVCEERERRVERSSSVTRVYRYRGSYTSSPYIGTAVLSGVTAAAVAGVIAAVCMNDERSTQAQKEGCLPNMLFGTPWAIDSVYSSIRAATAKPPKLIEKHTAQPVLAFSETPIRTAPATCETARLYLRPAMGPVEQSADDILSGKPPDPAPGFLDGATAIPLPPDGKVDLHALPEVVNRWGNDTTLGLWLVGPGGGHHRLMIHPCDALKPLLGTMAPATQSAFLRSCAPPPPPRR